MNEDPSRWTCPNHGCGAAIAVDTRPDVGTGWNIVRLLREEHARICDHSARPETMTDGRWTVEYGFLMEDGGLFAPSPTLDHLHFVVSRTPALKEIAAERVIGVRQVWQARATEWRLP